MKENSGGGLMARLRALRHALWRLPAGLVFPPCQICGVPLAPSRDCRAHVLPTAIGGRLAPRQIICRTCEAQLTRLTDAPLIAALGPWPARVGIPGGSHGGSAPSSARRSLALGPANVFPTALRALWLLHLAHREWPFWPGPLFVHRLADPASLAATLGYLPRGFPGLRGPRSDFAHTIVLKGSASARQLVGYVEIFGAIRLGGILVHDYPDDFEAIYVLDPLTVSDRSVEYRLEPRPAEWATLPAASAQGETAAAAMEDAAVQQWQALSPGEVVRPDLPVMSKGPESRPGH